MSNMKNVWILLALATSVVIAGPARAATTYLDIPVQIEGGAYPDQNIVVLLNSGQGLTKADPPHFQNAVTYYNNMIPDGETFSITLGLISAYGETVDHWSKGRYGDPVYTQVFTTQITGGMRNRIDCHITPPPQPITSDDVPRANTPTGTPVNWGPKTMDGGGIRTYSGEATEMITDLHVKGRGLDFVWARRYLAEKGVDSANGRRWDHSYNIRVSNVKDYDGIKYLNMGNGRVVQFNPTGYVSPYDYYEAKGWAAKMRRHFWSIDEEIELLFDNGVKWVFTNEPFGNDTVSLLDYIEDQNGNRLTFTYGTSTGIGGGTNDTGRLVQIEDTLGRFYDLAYYPDETAPDEPHPNAGKIHTLTDPTGRTITYTYDGENKLTQVGYPDARTLQYNYSGVRLTEIVDPRGITIVTNQYVGKQVVKQTRPHRFGTAPTIASYSVTNYTYTTFKDAAGKFLPLTIVNDPVGNVQLQIFNKKNQLAELRDYTGRAPDPADVVTWNTTAGDFTDNGPEGKLRNTAEFTDPDYFASTYTWNEHDNLTKMVQREYDESTETMVDGLTTNYTYEDESAPLKRGAVKTVTETHPDEPSSITTSNTYLVLEGDPDPAFHRIAVATTTDPESNVTAYQYDSGANERGNLTAIAYPGSSLSAPDESFAYGNFGELTGHTLPKSKNENGGDILRVDTYTYYTLNGKPSYLESTRQASNTGAPLISTYTYYDLGVLQSDSDPKGNTWSYTYNASEEVLTVTAPGNGGTSTFAYDANGNTATVTVQNLDEAGMTQGPDIVTAYGYDPLNRLEFTTEDFGVGGIGATTQYVYDSNGQPIETRSPLAVAGIEPTYTSTTEYDERGAPFRSATFGRPDNRQDYDEYGLPVRKVIAESALDLEGNPVERISSQILDGFRRVKSAQAPDGTTSSVGAYDERGLPQDTAVVGEALKDFGAGGWEPDGTLSNPRFEYDERGRVVGRKASQHDTVGTVTTYTKANQVFTITDADGETVTYGYDTYYRLKRIEDSKGNSQSYDYDENGNVLVLTQVDVPEAGGGNQTLVTTYQYDALDRVVQVTEPGGRVSQFWYDSRGNQIIAYDPEGNYTRSTFDALSRNTQVEFFDDTNALVATTAQTWDLNSRLISRIDPLNHTTAYEYDDQGYNTRIEYGDGGAHSLEYDDFGNVVRATDPAGNVVLSYYDSMNRLIGRYSETVAEGMKPILEYYYYDGMSRLIFAANANTAVAYAFDANAATPAVRETVSVKQTVSLTSADLDAGNFFESSRDTLTSYRVVTREFTFGGRPSKITYPSGRVVEFSYQNSGLLDKIREGANTIADYNYVGGRVAGRTAGGLVRMDVAYDTSVHGEHITGITHTKVSGGAPLENWTFDWDGNFNKVARHDLKRGVSHEYIYDGRNRMTRSLRNGVDSVVYDLDEAGNRLTTTAAPDPPQNYVVAALHEYSTSPLGVMEHDPNGNLVELPAQFERYQYDVTNGLLDRWGFGNILHHDYAGTITADYSILSGDFTAAEGYLAPEGGGTILNETVPEDVNQVTFSYLSKLDPDDPDGDPATADYGPDYYALFLMKVGQENQSPPDDEWSYLSLAIEPRGLVLRKWQDDEVVVVEEYPFTSARDTWYDIQIDFSGTGSEHVTVKHGLHGGTMATAANASTGLTNDHVNVGFAVGQLAKDGYLFDNLRIRGNFIEAESMEQEFIYDVFGRRVAKTTYDNYIAKTTYFAYDGDKVIEELDGDGNAEASYVYGQYLDEVLQMRRDTDEDGTPESYYYLHDDLFNVLALADEDGEIVEFYAYGDYGKPTVYDAAYIETGDESAYGNPYLFNGRRWDADTGLYWYRTRYMDPDLGRFISRDQIGLWGDENNLGNPFAYVGNNPWTHLDPYGEGVFTWLLTGDYNSSDWEAAKGFAEGATGGATIVADTFTFGQIDSLNAAAGGYEGSAYTASRVLSTVSREVAITAATLGIGTAASAGVRGAGMAHKAVLAYEAVDTAHTVGTGAYQMAQGDYLGGGMNLALGALGAGGAGRSLRGAGDAAGAGRGVGHSIGQGCRLMCFTEETLIQADYGTTRIGSIRAGDWVYSLDEESGDVELKEVTALYKRETPSLYILDLAGEMVETTREHPFYVEGQGWTEVQDLREGDNVQTMGGDTRPVTGIEVVYKPTMVYNFTVDGNHNYYVSEDGFLVHNCGGKIPGSKTETKLRAKRGPKTDPNAPHNKKIREIGDKLAKEGNVILAGGGYRPERLIRTLGGFKSGRRPDILYRTPTGKLQAINVGRANAQGLPITRELQALDDLNNIAKIPTTFIPYD